MLLIRILLECCHRGFRWRCWTEAEPAVKEESGSK